jgi:hypothetical protein
MKVIDVMKNTELLVDKPTVSTDEKANVLVEISKVDDIIKAKDKEIMLLHERNSKQQDIINALVEDKQSLLNQIAKLTDISEE